MVTPHNPEGIALMNITGTYGFMICYCGEHFLVKPLLLKHDMISYFLMNHPLGIGFKLNLVFECEPV